MKKIALGIIMAALLIGCGSKEKKETLTAEKINSMTAEQIFEEAKKEGRVDSVGMPDSWANWTI